MTEDNTPLNEILSDQPTEAIEAPVETPADPPAEASGPVRDERGRFASKGDTDAAPPAAQQDDEGPHVPRRALQDERSKRQAYEAELADLRAQLAQLQQPAPQQQTEQGPPDRWEDPEGYDRWLVAQATNQAMQAADERFAVQRIATSAEEAKAKYPDYLEKKGVFEAMAQHNPMLIQEMMRHPNPAQYAYDVAKTQLELQQYGGLEGLIEARIKARETQALQSVQQHLPSAPPTISDSRSTGPRSGPAWGGPTALSDILS